MRNDMFVGLESRTTNLHIRSPPRKPLQYRLKLLCADFKSKINSIQFNSELKKRMVARDQQLHTMARAHSLNTPVLNNDSCK